MKISYITVYNPLDIHNWSGLSYSIAKSLEMQGCEIDYIGNLKTKTTRFIRLKKRIYTKLKKAYHFERIPYVANNYASQALERVKIDSDIILSPGTIPIALLKTKKPKVFFADATFAGMIGYYDYFTNLSRETINNGNYLEQKALDSCALAVFASEWAAKSALENYKVDEKKVKVIPFGANLECNRTIADIDTIVKQRNTKVCKLLFVGMDWERKGGAFAVKVAEQLNKIGLPTELHVAGIEQIPINNVPRFVINHGFISKSTPEGRMKLDELFATAHFFILPAKAECYGLVFCEANSFGLPCLASNTGGISTIIRNKINGQVFPINSDIQEYVDYITYYWNHFEEYKLMAKSSFYEFENWLNWNTTGKLLVNLLKGLI